MWISARIHHSLWKDRSVPHNRSATLPLTTTGVARTPDSRPALHRRHQHGMPTTPTRHDDGAERPELRTDQLTHGAQHAVEHDATFTRQLAPAGVIIFWQADSENPAAGRLKAHLVPARCQAPRQ